MASIEELTISDSEEAPQLIETSERQITVSPLSLLFLSLRTLVARVLSPATRSHKPPRRSDDKRAGQQGSLVAGGQGVRSLWVWEMG